MRNPELAAAYERIEELETTLRRVRAVLIDDTEPFDTIEICLAHIDGALVDKTVLAA